MVKPYIHENLPKKYHNKQSLMYYQYDILIDMLIKATEYNLADTQLQGDLLDELEENEDIIDFLIKRQRHKEVAKIFKPHLFFSILVDFTDFILESLRCVEKGKVIVAFSLSRKPLQDNLFYLCWLLTDPEGLTNKILEEDSSSYDISEFRRKNKEELFRVFEETCNTLSTQHEIDPGHYDAKILYDLIYEKSSPYGMSSVWDQSVHLVTTNKHYKTTPGNINFLFSHKENLLEFTDYYFQKMPILLDFCLEVCVKLYENILNVPSSLSYINFLIRIIKRHEGFDIPFLELKSMLEETLPNHLTFNCDNCNRDFKMTKKISEEFFSDSLVTCPYCASIERTGKYLIGDDQLEDLKNQMIITLN